MRKTYPTMLNKHAIIINKQTIPTKVKNTPTIKIKYTPNTSEIPNNESATRSNMLNTYIQSKL